MAASCGAGESVAETGVNGVTCYVGASNLVAEFLPRGEYKAIACRGQVAHQGIPGVGSKATFTQGYHTSTSFDDRVDCRLLPRFLGRQINALGVSDRQLARLPKIPPSFGTAATWSGLR